MFSKNMQEDENASITESDGLLGSKSGSEDELKSDSGDESLIALNEAFDENIRPFIDVIDNLRKLGVQEDISLPNVVVVGDQSSGKSSIIEALSGIQLPRGKGIVTRCPLELQLMRSMNKEWNATLSYSGMSKNTCEPDMVQSMIEEAQNVICGDGKDIKDELLTLRIESSEEDAPDLTLIDLPGISRIAIEGQPSDICQRIRRIVHKNVENENTVILCLISANLDFAVNESLSIAKKVDSNGRRTLGIITKPDLADDAHKLEVIEILNNARYHLQKGYVMVKCRSQEELENGLTLKESVENEKNFFLNDPYYKYVDSYKLGIHNLGKVISQELVEVIKGSIPSLKVKISEELRKTTETLENLGMEIPIDGPQKQFYLSKIIWNLLSEVGKCFETCKTYGTSRSLFSQWRTNFAKFLTEIEEKRKKSVNSIFSVNNLKENMNDNRGKEIIYFLNFEFFEKLIQKHVNSYKSDATDMMRNISKCTETYLFKIAEDIYHHLPGLEKEIKIMLTSVNEKALSRTTEMVNLIFDQEKHIFTMDSLLQKEMEELEQIEKNNQNMVQAPNGFRASQNQFTSNVIHTEYIKANSNINAEQVQKILKLYLKIVNKRLADRIPLTVIHNNSTLFKVDLEEECAKLLTDPKMLNKVAEERNVQEKRNAANAKVRRLNEARASLINF